MSEEAVKIAVKRRKVKDKGERKRYTQLNAEFQRIVRGNKNTLLNEKFKEIKENNRMGKTSRTLELSREHSLMTQMTMMF